MRNQMKTRGFGSSLGDQQTQLEWFSLPSAAFFCGFCCASLQHGNFFVLALKSEINRSSAGSIESKWRYNSELTLKTKLFSFSFSVHFIIRTEEQNRIFYRVKRLKCSVCEALLELSQLHAHINGKRHQKDMNADRPPHFKHPHSQCRFLMPLPSNRTSQVN